MKTATLRILLLLAWFLAAAVLPYFFLPNHIIWMKFRALGNFPPEFRAGFIITASIATLEAVLILIFGGLLKRYRVWHSGAVVLPRALTATYFIVVTLYIFFQIGSWIWYYLTGIFVSLRLVSLLSFLTDPTFYRVLQANEVLYFPLVLLAAFGMAAVCWTLVPIFQRQSVTTLLWVSLIAMTSACYGIAVLRRHPPIEDSRYILENGFSPQLSLYSAGLLQNNISFQPPSDKSRFEPRHSIDDYIGSINQKTLDKKNVLIIIIEALRQDAVEATAGPRPVMPTLSALQHSGVAFEKSYSQATDTEASILTILTGTYALRHPYRSLRLFEPNDAIRLYDIFHPLGYHTFYLGSEWRQTRWITDSASLDSHIDPYDRFASLAPSLEPKWRSSIKAQSGEPIVDSILGPLALAEIKKAQQNGQPFFGAIYYDSSHFPYDLQVSQYQPYGDVSTGRLGKGMGFLGYPAELAEPARKRYLNSLSHIDHLLSLLVQEMKENGIFQDTIIVVTGDHGEFFHEHGKVAHGRDLYEAGIAVPLIILNANEFLSHVDTKSPIGHIDIAPTLLSILGLPNYPGFQGESAARTVPEGSCRPLFLSVQTWLNFNGVLCWPWKYTIDKNTGTEELFNLELDSEETKNLIRENKARAEQLRSAARDFRANQFAYYGEDTSLIKQFFPPKFSRSMQQ